MVQLIVSVFLLVAGVQQDKAITLVKFHRTFDTVQTCEDFVKSPTYREQLGGVHRYVQAHVPEGQDFTLSPECKLPGQAV